MHVTHLCIPLIDVHVFQRVWNEGSNIYSILTKHMSHTTGFSLRGDFLVTHFSHGLFTYFSHGNAMNQTMPHVTVTILFMRLDALNFLIVVLMNCLQKCQLIVISHKFTNNYIVRSPFT